MKKHLFSIIAAIVLALSCLFPVFATETDDPSEPVIRAPGWCGENIQWSYSDGVLTIAGEGKMDDFTEDGAPWFEYREDIREVIFQDGVTYVGAYAFADYDNLESVDFGDAMYELGQRSFYSCDGLTLLNMPATFKVFGEESLRSCRKLTEIHCEGRPLTFRLNSLWDSYVTIYFPASRPWSVDYIAQLEEAFHGRIEFIASDGTDPYEPTEPTEATEATEATEETEATGETTEATEEATEEVTEAPTQAPTEEPTQEPTVPPTQTPEEPEPTVSATEGAPEVPEEPDSRSWIALMIIGVVIAFLLLGTGITMLTGASRKKGRYSR